jgi:hypothetical protein
VDCHVPVSHENKAGGYSEMTVTLADIVGILTAIGALSGLGLGISNLRQTRSLNAKLMAEAQKTKSESEKIDQEKTSEGMNSVIGGAKQVVDTGTTLLAGLVARIDKLEGQLTTKEDEIVKGKEELAETTKRYQKTISRMMHAIERNIEKRNDLAEKNKCLHDCVAVDAVLQKELAIILATSENEESSFIGEIKNG